MSQTIKFSKHKNEEIKVRETLKKVRQALNNKGYDSINQITGYLISGDPTYITSKEGARQLITQIDRDEIIEKLLIYFLEDEKI